MKEKRGGGERCRMFLSGLQLQSEITQLLEELYGGLDRATPVEVGECERYSVKRSVERLRKARAGVQADSDRRFQKPVAAAYASATP